MPSPSARPLRIYLVEDEALIAMEIGDRLAPLGYDVCGQTARGERALEEIPRLQPDLVLMDIKLAGQLSGIETCHRLRPHWEGPVVFLSAFSNAETLREAIDTTAHGYLVKPFDERVLHATLQAACYRHEAERLRRSETERLDAAVQQRTAELRASEAQLRDFFDGTTDLIQSFAPDGRLFYTNRAWRAALGYTEAEVTALNLADILPPEFHAHCQLLLQQLMRGDDVGLIEVTFVAKDGRRIEVEGRVNARFECGQAVATRGIFRDVTERKRAEAALDQHRRRLDLVLHSLEIGAWHWDIPANHRTFDDQVCRLLGLDPRTFRGTPGEFFGTLHPDDLPGLQAALARTVATGAPYEVTFRVPRPDGTVRHLCGRGRLACDAAGQPLRLDGILWDVTAAVEAAATLTESEERHRTLYRTSRDALMTVEPPTWKFTSCNAAALTLFGARDEAEFHALGPWDVSPERQPDGRISAEAAPAMIAQAMRDGSHFFEWVHRRLDGTPFFATVLLSRITHGGRTYIQATARDITAQKQAEATLRADARRHTQMFLAAPAATTLSDTGTGEFIDVNERFAELVGRPREQLIGHSSVAIGLWRDSSDRLRIEDTLRREGRVERAEVGFLMPDGRVKDVAISVVIAEVGDRRLALATLSDITARKDAERALREREALLSSINSNLVGVCIYRMAYHPDGRMECLYISPTIELLTGLTPAQVYAHPAVVFGLIHAQDLPRFRQLSADVLRSGGPVDATIRMTTPSGDARWAQFRSRLAERRADGTQVRDGVVVDVTATKEAEAELAATRQRLELSLRASRTCTWEEDSAANRLILDPAWAEMLGRPPGETVSTSRSQLAFVHPADRSLSLVAARRLLRGETDDYFVEYRVATADGGWLWIQSRGRVLARNAQGHPLRVVGTNTDITARRLAEEEVRKLNRNLEQLVTQRTAALAESEARFRTLFHRSPILIGLFTFPEGRIVEINAACFAVFGYSSKESVGRTAHELGLWDNATDRAHFIAELQANGQVTGFETTFRRRGQEPFPVIFTATAVEIGGQPHALVSIEDITSRRRAELRVAGLSRLSRTLAEAVTPRAAAIAILDTARELLGWDAAWLQLWNEERQAFEHPVNFDVIEGRVTEIQPNPATLRDPSPLVRRAMRDGPQLHLRDSETEDADSHPFGSPHRSLSLLFAPIRREGRLLGMLSIQSYVARAYDAAGLELLTAIADHAAGALARLQARAALAASEERFHLVNRATFDVIWDQDIRTGAIWWNEHFERIYGHTVAAAAANGDFWRAHLHPDDHARVTARVTEVLASSAATWSDHYRFRRKDGTYAHVEDRAFIVRDEAGRPIRMLGAMEDRTVHHEHEQRFRALFDRSPILLALLTVPEGRIVEVNATASTAFGFTREEVIGRTTAELGLWADPADRERYKSELQTTGHVTGLEVRLRRKNGEIFTALFSGSVIEIGGRPYSLNSLQDISALREREALFRGVFDASPIPILLSAVPDGRLIEVNAAALRLFGYARHEVIGHTTAEFNLWAQPAQRDEFFRRIAADKSVEAFEATMCTKTGEQRTMLCTGTLLAVGGRTCVLSSAVEITAVRTAEAERAQLQAKAFQSQKFEALGALAGGVAHDFNNILTGVINFTALAKADCPPTHPQIAEHLGHVLACSERAKELTRQILLYSRAEDGRQEPLQLPLLLKETLTLLRSTLPAYITLATDIDPQVPIVMANATQLHQLVINLGVNAGHAMENRPGKIVLRLDSQTITAATAPAWPDLRPGPHARLEVSDNGSGMEPAVLSRIFEPFFTTKGAGVGTGLGLAVVNSVVRSHHGAIAVRSSPGHGTTFTILLPAHGAPASTRHDAPLPPSARGEHILLVDDEAIVLSSLGPLLQRLGYRVTAERFPTTALARLMNPAEKFDALLTDFQMPGMTGFELARAARSVRRGLPVLVMTGFAGRVTAAQIEEAGVLALIDKPVALPDLAATLARVLAPATGPAAA